jgi:hypothetical protein
MGTALNIDMHSILVVCEIQLLFNIRSFHLNDLCSFNVGSLEVITVLLKYTILSRVSDWTGGLDW